MTQVLSADEGPSFVVLEPSGDIVEWRESRLYHEDTRFLALSVLRLDVTRRASGKALLDVELAFECGDEASS